MVVEKAETVKRRLKERFRRVPKTIDMTSELLAQRRREAAKEHGE